MSITFEKIFPLKFITLALLLFLSGKIFAQADSVQATGLKDSLRDERLDSAILQFIPHNFSFQKEKEKLQRWNDFFPSYWIMKFEGVPVFKPEERLMKREKDDLEFWVALLLLAFLALIRFGFAKDFEDLRQTFKNWGASQQVIRELGVGVAFGIVLLNLFASFVLSFYVFFLLRFFKAVLIEPQWLLLLFSFACVEAALLARYLLLKIAEGIFPFRKEIKLFNYYELQLNRVMGVCLFPLLLIIGFSSSVLTLAAIYFSFALVLSLLLIRYVKGFNIGVSYFGSHLIHFLLYICALEIAPVLIIIRLLLDIGPIRLSF